MSIILQYGEERANFKLTLLDFIFLENIWLKQ